MILNQWKYFTFLYYLSHICQWLHTSGNICLKIWFYFHIFKCLTWNCTEFTNMKIKSLKLDSDPSMMMFWPSTWPCPTMTFLTFLPSIWPFTNTVFLSVRRLTIATLTGCYESSTPPFSWALHFIPDVGSFWSPLIGIVSCCTRDKQDKADPGTHTPPPPPPPDMDWRTEQLILHPC